MKFLIILMAFISSTVFAQSYKYEIAKHREAYKADFIKETSSPLKESDLEHLHFFWTLIDLLFQNKQIMIL